MSNERENEINEQFKNLNLKLLFWELVTKDYEHFLTISCKYLSKSKNREKDYKEHNRFFERFCHIWEQFIKSGNTNQAKCVWLFALKVAGDLEKIEKIEYIHKGTPYYFLGGTHILEGDYDGGFLLMHQALEEDNKSKLKDDPPAKLFVTLDYADRKQFLFNVVSEKAYFLEEYLTKFVTYNSDLYNSNFDLKSFKNKFLKKDDLREIVFLFVYNLFRVYKLNKSIDKKLKQNDFASQYEINIIFDLCKVIDKFIELKDSTLKGKYFSEKIKFLSKKSKLPCNDKIIEFNSYFQSNFKKALQDALDGKLKFKDGSELKKIETSLVIAYGFRNYSAHNIENQPIIYENFDAIIEHIFYSLFFSIEQLSP